MKIFRYISLFITLVLISGCTAFTGPTDTPPLTPSPAVVASPTPTSEPGTPIPEQVTLNIWLPPQFDPAGESTAGNVLQGRLEAFEQANPGVRVEVRIKAAHGPGGLLASLSAASVAAPVALPDVIALPRVDLESAAVKGLLVPLTELSSAVNDPDWFEYAISLGMLQEDHFGLPFAGDTLVMIYRPSQIGEPPPDFTGALLLEEALTFPAASPEALFTLALYQAAGGQTQDEDGRPILEVSALSSVLTFFQEAEIAGLTPFWLTQYDSFSAALEPFQENRAQMAVSWVSTFLSDPAY